MLIWIHCIIYLAYDKIKIMDGNIKNKRGGFLQIIIGILIALLIMKYLGVTVSGVVNWFLNTFHSVLK